MADDNTRDSKGKKKNMINYRVLLKSQFHGKKNDARLFRKAQDIRVITRLA